LPRMTYDEFLAWKPDDLHVEWVSGELQQMSPVSFVHQEIAIFLMGIMSAYAQCHDIGVVSAGPFQMRLVEADRGREPDVFFVSKQNVGRIKDTYLDGPADLAVEIVSPGGAIRDRGEKYAEYEASGVREYWIIDPAVRRADFFVLDTDGRYNRALIEADGTYHSIVLNGFWISVNWLWQSPLPLTTTVLKLLNLV
jgi:Uma2 family endonuclease